jgi:DNA-binding Xre family transcriptional regulator
MKKKDLQKLAGISSASITKLGKNENVNTDILQKICSALECDISDIMEMVPDKQGS